MGVLDQIKKKQEQKVQEIQEQIQGGAPTELTQEILNLKSEVDRLNSLNLRLDSENTNLLNKIKATNEMEKEIRTLRDRIEESKTLSTNTDKKAKMLMEEVTRLKQNLSKEQYNCQELQKKLHNEKSVTDTVIDNHDVSIRNLKSAFVGNLLLSAILLLFVTIQKKAIFIECGDWFKDRATNLYDFFRWLKDGLYQGTYQLIEGKLHAGEVGSNLLTILVILLICAGLFMLLKKAKEEFDDKSFHAMYYYGKGRPFMIFKAVISVDIAIGLFIACLTFYEPFKNLMPSFNIFTIWLLLTFAGMSIWNGIDWIKGFGI